MSNSATPKLKQLARRLLAHELESSKPADAKDSAAFHVCEKLRKSLGKLMGAGGFRALLARALALAVTEVQWLGALRIQANGSLEGFDQIDGEHYPRALDEGEAVLVAQLLGLLTTFIGAELMLRLLHDIWPELEDFKF